MKTKLACLLVVALTLGAGGESGQKQEVAKFAGTWALSECRYDGRDHSSLKFKVVFRGNEGKIEGNDKVASEYDKIKFKLDATMTPRAIDITVSAGSQTDATMQGIYEFKDGELRICAKVFGNGRPKDFDAPDGSSSVLLVLKRESK